MKKFSKLFPIVLMGLFLILTGCAQETWPKTNISYTADAESYAFSSDRGRSIWEGKKAVDYKYRDRRITDINFPLMEYDVGNEAKTFTLVHFDCFISSEDAIKQMKAEGYRPATMRELFAFVEKYPKEVAHLNYSVVALGQVARIDGHDNIGYLGQLRHLEGWHVRLGSFKGVWGDNCRFLAVRN